MAIAVCLQMRDVGFAIRRYICRVNWKVCLFGLGLMFVGCLAKGQLLNSPKALPAAFAQTPKLLVGLDTKRSFITDRDVKIMGVRVGLDFDKRARVGFGVYTLASPYHRVFSLETPFGNPRAVNSQLRFVYMSAYFEYVLLLTKHWEVSLPLHVGVGDVSFSKLAGTPNPFLMSELTVLASYKIFPFFGLAAGVGYRQIVLGGDAIGRNFNAPTYNLGIKLWAGYLVEKVLEKRAKKKAQSS